MNTIISYSLVVISYTVVEVSTSYSLTASPKDPNQFKNYIYIHENCHDNNFDEELELSDIPKIVIRCGYSNSYYDVRLSDGPKQIPHFGAQRYTHIFYKVESDKIMNFWKELYGRLTITKAKQDFFIYTTNTYNKKYAHYNPDNLKLDYWRSQWNQDKFIIKDSHDIIYKSVEDNFHQLPTFLQQSVKTYPEPYQFAALFYSIMSGGGAQCKFSNRYEQLRHLTQDFNAYDMLFCDAFSFHNLSFQVNYYYAEFRWYTSFVVRDDLISSFPPDPNAVFYASTGITFFMLKESPILWSNIYRPFTYVVWIGVCISCIISGILSRLLSKTGRNCLSRKDFRTFFVIDETMRSQNTAEKVWSIFIKMARIIITSAYSGMILVGYLNPSYRWSPKTFKELNETTNIICATGIHTAVTGAHLKNTFTLNGISEERWRDRNKTSPGSYLIDAENDVSNRYAMFMFDDRKNYLIYSRGELKHTAKYIHRLEMDKESVLQEMRYVSVNSGATKLHFLIDSIQRLFETGTWLKWRYLEKNYFDYVAPILVLERFGVDFPPLLRTLNTGDITSAFYILGIGVILSGLKFFIELYWIKQNRTQVLQYDRS